MKKIYIAILAIAAIFLALGCAGNNTNTAETSKAGNVTEVKQDAAQEPLTVIDSKLVKESYGGYSITGTAKANKDLTYAEVSAKCYDSGGAVLGSYLTNMNNLKAGETWNFKIIGPMDASVRVENYTIGNGNSF